MQNVSDETTQPSLQEVLFARRVLKLGEERYNDLRASVTPEGVTMSGCLDMNRKKWRELVSKNTSIKRMR